MAHGHMAITYLRVFNADKTFCTASREVQNILREVVVIEAVGTVSTWYARVPSPNDVADGPSRFQSEM